MMAGAFRLRFVPSTFLSLAACGVLGASGCSTTAVNADSGASGGGSSGGTADSGGSGSGGAAADSGGSGSGGAAADSGGGDSSSIIDAGSVTCVLPPQNPDGGPAVLTQNATPLALDAGGAYLSNFGAYNGYGGGTFLFPTAGPGVDMLANPDAGIACTTLASQNSFIPAFSPSTNAWTLTGTVATYSGFGMWQYHCDNASAYKGIQFTVSGDLGVPGEDAGDAGTATQMQIQVTQLSNDMAVNANGTVNPGATCASNCVPASYYFSVPSTPTVVKALWSEFSGGSPHPTIDNPGQIAQIQFQLPWPCTGGVPYTTNVTIQDLAFIQ
ncbi:MAG: hypothetical protein WBY94_27760 [Polyangiaceae bacterium]